MRLWPRPKRERDWSLLIAPPLAEDYQGALESVALLSDLLTEERTRAQALDARLRALARLLSEEGHATPYAARMIHAVLDEHPTGEEQVG